MDDYFDHIMVNKSTGERKVIPITSEKYDEFRHRVVTGKIDAMKNVELSKKGFFDIEFDRGEYHHQFRLATERMNVCGISSIA